MAARSPCTVEWILKRLSIRFRLLKAQPKNRNSTLSYKNTHTCFSGGFDKLAISFNGGKDCTVMLHLFKMALKRNGLAKDHPIKLAYVRPKNPIPLVDEFVVSTADEDPSLLLFTYAYPISMKEAFGSFTAEENIVAVLVGVRRTDPYGCMHSI